MERSTVREDMKIPTFVTHYYEEIRGPFLNICDLSDEDLRNLVDSEKEADTAFNRFSLGPDFIDWRRSADDQSERTVVWSGSELG